MSDTSKINDTTSPVLQVQNACVNVENISLLDSVDLEVMPGEVVALLGPNGAGKSTLIRTIANEQQLDQGSVAFNQIPMLEWSAKDRAKHMAVLPQKSLLNFPFLVKEVVSLARTPHSTGVEADNKIVAEALKYVDASHLADRIYTNLSGGEQQRVQLARVLAQIWEPNEKQRLLVLDEPSSSFDLAHQQLLISLVRKLADRNIGILVVLHDLNMAISCADKVAVLCCGQMRAFGKPDSVLTKALLKDVFCVDARFLTDPETREKFVGLAKPSLKEGN